MSRIQSAAVNAKQMCTLCRCCNKDFKPLQKWVEFENRKLKHSVGDDFNLVSASFIQDKDGLHDYVQFSGTFTKCDHCW